MTWENVQMIVVIVAVGVVITFLLAKPIGAYQIGGNVCKKYGREREASAYRAHPALQYAFCLRHCFCGTDLFCGYRSAASGKTDDQNSKADYSDSGMFSVWRCNHIVL